jgi:hypothetical protein
MELPFLASPDSLTGLSDQLRATAGQIGRIAEQVDDLARDDGWSGGGQRAFADAAREAAGRCTEAAHRLTVDAARIERLAEQLSAELAVLYRLEHEVMGALDRLAVRAVTDVTGEAQSVYDRVRRELPGRGSPGWRDLASTLLGGGLL